MNFAICLLAFGTEHVKECNHLIESLYAINKDLDIFVYTNDWTGELHHRPKQVLTTADFNYNLKVEAINYGLLYYDTILFIDTDTHVNKLIDLSLLENLKEDGFYTTKQPYTVFTHQNEVVSVHSLINETEYGKKIIELSNVKDITFLDEQKFIIKIKDEDARYEFCQAWKKLFKETKHYHIKNKQNGLPGIYEGLIISAACKMVNLPIIHNDTNTKLFFNQLSHYGWDADTPSNTSLI